MTVELLYIIIAIGMLVGAIIVWILLARHFAKTPSVTLVQGRLNDESDIDIEDTIPYLRLNNLA